MAPATTRTCSSCGRDNADAALTCELCGDLLRHEDEAASPAVGGPIPASRLGGYAQGPMASFQVSEPEGRFRLDPVDPLDDRIWVLPSRWFYLLLGLVLSQVFVLGPGAWFGWLFSSLAHEMGHSVVGILFGYPTIPAIRLDGHAVAMHGEQSIAFGLIVWAALGWAVWLLRDRKVYAIPLAVITLLGPILAFTPVARMAVLVMGHGGELLFAGICFTRVLTGCTYTRGGIERALYAVAGWFLLLKNTLFFWGLATSLAALDEYYGNGSFGLTNDFIRLASHEHLNTTVQSLAWGMLLPCAAVLPVAYICYRARRAVGEH